MLHSREWPLDRQAIEVPNSARPGYTPIYRNRTVPELVITDTAYTSFNHSRDRSPNNDFVGSRPWDWVKGDFADHFEFITYSQAEELRTAIGSGLTQLGKEGKLGANLPATQWCYAMWANNRPEFQLLHQAANAYNRRLVCIYDSYDAENAAYILDHSESRVVFTTSSHLEEVLARSGELPNLKLVVLIDREPPKDLKAVSPRLPPGQLTSQQIAAAWAREKGVTLMRFEELIAFGRKNLSAHTPPQSQDEVALFCYTSGTTGKPKAAFVSHRQLGFSGSAFQLMMSGNISTMIGYLPVAHIYEVLLEAGTIVLEGRIGYFSGDPLRLVEDCQILKPEFFPSVPRVLNRIAAQIQEQMAGDNLKAKLLRRAVESKIAYHDVDGTVTHAFWDRIVFKKVKAILGGNVANIVTGSAPIRGEVLKLLRVCFCVDLREGYGQTENTGFCTTTLPFDKDVGSVGPPQVGTEIRLKDCPELGYFSTDKPRPRGELLSRGQSVFPGYYKDAKKTAETIDEEGWMHSGDVAAVDERGRFYIIDRVKNLVKLSQGEYVAIEKVEQTYGGVPYLAQVWVYGDSLQDYLVAVAVPEPEPFARFASKVLGKAVGPADVAALVSDEKVVQAVLHDLVRLGKSRGLNSIELLRGLHLSAELFSVENGLLTPTFKTKRPEAAKYYEQQLKALYGKGPSDISAARA